VKIPRANTPRAAHHISRWAERVGVFSMGVVRLSYRQPEEPDRRP